MNVSAQLLRGSGMAGGRGGLQEYSESQFPRLYTEPSKQGSSNIGRMKRSNAWKMPADNPEPMECHANTSYCYERFFLAFTRGLQSPFQNGPYCKRRSTEYTSKETSNGGRCVPNSPGGFQAEGKVRFCLFCFVLFCLQNSAGSSYMLHFTDSSEKLCLDIHSGGHGGTGRQGWDSSFALWGPFCPLNGHTMRVGTVWLLGCHGTTLWAVSTFPNNLFHSSAYSDLKMQEKAEGEEASGGRRFPSTTPDAPGAPPMYKVIWGRHPVSPQCCPLELWKTSKSVRTEGTMVAGEGTCSTGD